MVKKNALLLLLMLIFGQNSDLKAGINGFSFDASYASRYIWRGFDLTPNNHPVMQPSVTYEFGSTGLWVNFWSSFGVTDRAVTEISDELDYSIGYGRTAAKGLIDFSVGFIYYTFPQVEGDNTSPEVFAGISFPKFVLSPSFTVYRDFNLGDGYYVTGSVSKELSPLPLSAGLSVGYNSNLFVDDEGISDVVVSCSYEFKAGSITLSPSVNYAHIPMETVNSDDEFWFSVGVGF